MGKPQHLRLVDGNGIRAGGWILASPIPPPASGGGLRKFTPGNRTSPDPHHGRSRPVPGSGCVVRPRVAAQLQQGGMGRHRHCPLLASVAVVHAAPMPAGGPGGKPAPPGWCRTRSTRPAAFTDGPDGNHPRIPACALLLDFSPHGAEGCPSCIFRGKHQRFLLAEPGRGLCRVIPDDGGKAVVRIWLECNHAGLWPVVPAPEGRRVGGDPGQ